jgi:hypothetical protein
MSEWPKVAEGAMMDRAKQWRIVLVAALIVLVWFPVPSQGEPVTLDATTRGVQPPGGAFAMPPTANSFYLVGFASIAEFRNFFVFDLAGLSGIVNTAKLLLTNPPGGFNSVDALEQFTTFDVTSDFALLGTASPLIYSDLGSGTVYGSYTASIADNASVVELSLNAAAVEAIQASLGSQFAVGGAITTLAGAQLFGPSQALFFGTGVGDVTQLQLDLTPSSVPEPSTLLLLSSGAVVALVKRKRAVGFRRRIPGFNLLRRGVASEADVL